MRARIVLAIAVSVTVTVVARPLSKYPPEPPKFRSFDKTNGRLVWEYLMPKQPAATPMTYLHQGRQYIVVAIGTGDDAELVAFALRPRAPNPKSH